MHKAKTCVSLYKVLQPRASFIRTPGLPVPSRVASRRGTSHTGIIARLLLSPRIAILTRPSRTGDRNVLSEVFLYTPSTVDITITSVGNIGSCDQAPGLTPLSGTKCDSAAGTVLRFARARARPEEYQFRGRHCYRLGGRLRLRKIGGNRAEATLVKS